MDKVHAIQNNQNSNLQLQDEDFIKSNFHSISSQSLFYIAEQSHQCSQSMINIQSSTKSQKNKPKPQQKSIKTQRISTSPKPIKKIVITRQSKPTKQLSIQRKLISMDESNNRLCGVSINKQYQHLDDYNNLEFDKLIQTTSKCVDYYHQFVIQKQSQLESISSTFTQINQNITTIFQQLTTLITQQQTILKTFLHKKYSQIFQIKSTQDMALQSILQQIKHEHLTNLLANRSGDQLQIKMKMEFDGYKDCIGRFMGEIRKIQESGFRDGVEETVGFVHNVIMEEVEKLVSHKFVTVLCEKGMLKREGSREMFGIKDQMFLIKHKKPQNQGQIGHSVNYEQQSYTKLFQSVDDVSKQQQYKQNPETPSKSNKAQGALLTQILNQQQNLSGKLLTYQKTLTLKEQTKNSQPNQQKNQKQSQNKSKKDIITAKSPNRLKTPSPSPRQSKQQKSPNNYSKSLRTSRNNQVTEFKLLNSVQIVQSSRIK